MTETQSGGARKRTAAKPKEPEVRILTLDEIETLDDLPEKTLLIPEWGENVGVKLRALTKQEQIDVRNRATVAGVVNEDEADLLAIAASLVEPTMTPDQISLLRTKNAAAIDRMSAALIELNGLTAEALSAMEAAFRAVAGATV